jgi:hypothetical protein
VTLIQWDAIVLGIWPFYVSPAALLWSFRPADSSSAHLTHPDYNAFMFLPTTPDEVDRLGWDELDIILVPGNQSA